MKNGHQEYLSCIYQTKHLTSQPILLLRCPLLPYSFIPQNPNFHNIESKDNPELSLAIASQ
jgi:hypothetical protein